MQTVNTQTEKKVTFLNEWTEEQFSAMKRMIVKHFNARRPIRTLHGTYNSLMWGFKPIDEILGLAYTSTGVWACYGVCNTACYFDLHNTYQYSYFVIGNDGNFYAILQDKEENELIIPL